MPKESAVSVVTIRVVGALLTVFILGGIGLAIAQGVTTDKVDRIEIEQDRRAPIIDSVDVIQSDIKHIREDMGDLEVKMGAVEDSVEAMEDKMDENHTELMHAIRNSQ